MNKSSGTYIVDSDFNIVNFNDTAKEIYPQLVKNEKCYKVLMGLDSPCGPCPIVNQIQGPRTYMDPIRNIQETVDAVEIPLEGRGKGYALVFSTVGTDAQITATLPKTNDELKALAIVKAITAEYHDVYTYNIMSGLVTTIRKTGNPVINTTKFTNNISYNKIIDDYIQNTVFKEDQKSFYEQTKIEYILKQLNKKEYFNIHYRILEDQKISHYVLKIARIGDDKSYDNIVFAFLCEDEDMTVRLQALELSNALQKVEVDSFIGLYTKEAFFRHSDALKKENPKSNFDLLIMKIANIAEINHQFGHLAGDKVLQSVATLLKEHQDKNRVIGYMGDGRFASVSLHEDSQTRQNEIAYFMTNTINKQDVKNINFKWAAYNEFEKSTSVEEIYNRTKEALSIIRYTPGRNYIEYNQDIFDQLMHEKIIEYRFETAIESNRIVPFFQPKYDVNTHEIVGAEALSRWIKTNGEFLSPAEYIHVLERSDKISKLDMHIFKKVCEFQKILKENHLEQIPISVNLSRASMFRNDISTIFAEIAKEFDIEPKYIPIEITESIAVRAVAIKEFIKGFEDKGFKLHMDDFGSGYSSLASLQVINFETIKIDKSLVDFIGKNSANSLLKHTISYAKENGMSVVAEGVENKNQLEFLQKNGCDQIQGYYFSKPLEQCDFLTKLKKDA